MLILPMLLGAFRPPTPEKGGLCHRLSLGPRTMNLLASCYVRRLHLHSRQPYRHALHWRRSTLKATKAFAQPSLGKNNSKAGGAKRSSSSFARSIPSSKPDTDMGMEDDFSA